MLSTTWNDLSSRTTRKETKEFRRCRRRRSEIGKAGTRAKPSGKKFLSFRQPDFDLHFCWFAPRVPDLQAGSMLLVGSPVGQSSPQAAVRPQTRPTASE